MISKLDKIAEQIPANKEIIFVFGNFNILHTGHVQLLKFSRDRGDFLVVGLTPDDQKGVSEGLKIRARHLEELKHVDLVVSMSLDVEEYVKVIKPKFLVMGDEHKFGLNKRLEKTLKNLGGQVLYSSGIKESIDPVFSYDRNFKNDIKWRELAQDFVKRHAINTSRLREILFSFSKLKVTIVGDIIIDEYISCSPIGISQEDQNLVLKEANRQKFVGGAAILAAHANSLRANTKFYSVTGNDESSHLIKKFFAENKIANFLLEDGSRISTVKQKFKTDGKPLFRLSNFDDHEINEELANNLTQALKSTIDKDSLMAFSDFSYGCITDKMIRELTQYCLEEKIMLVADSQTSSQIGDITRFTDCELISPTEHEARISLHDKKSSISVLADKLMEITSSKNVIITLGKNGILIKPNSTDNLISYDNLPAFNLNPVDASGAGDVFLIVSGLSLRNNANIWEASLLGSIAAAIHVGKVGNSAINFQEIMDLL